eukprot:EG_transcript_15139
MPVTCKTCRGRHFTQKCLRTSALPSAPPPARFHALYANTKEMEQCAKYGFPDGVRQIVDATTDKDGWFLAVAAKAFRSMRCWEDLNSLWQESSNSSLLNAYNCNEFLLGFLESGNEVQLLEVLRCVRQKQIQKNYLMHALVMNFCRLTGETDMAEKLFREKLSLDAISRQEAPPFNEEQLVGAYFQYITVLAQQGKWAEIEEAIRELLDEQVSFNKYVPLARLYVNAGRSLELEGIVDAIRESGNLVPNVLYYALITGYAEYADRLQDVLYTARRPMDAEVQRAVEQALDDALALRPRRRGTARAA